MFLSTLSCVSFQSMNKTGTTSLAGFTHPRRSTPWSEFLSRPITDILRRSYLVSEQSPASSHSAPIQALDYCTTGQPLKSSIFYIFFEDFSTVFAGYNHLCLCNITNTIFADFSAKKLPQITLRQFFHTHAIKHLQSKFHLAVKSDRYLCYTLYRRCP